MSGGALEVLAGPPRAGELDVMSFNVRYARDRGAYSWPRRRPVVRDLLARERPHLIGTQEGLSTQVRDIDADLDRRYGYLGMGREGGSRGEHMAVFFDRTRLQPQHHGHFWLSDTPEVVGSNTWGGGSVRMVTWVRFLDRTTGGQLYAVNTHLDNASARARAQGAELIRYRLDALRPRLPIVLTGDFNTPAEPGRPAYEVLVTRGGYVDTWTRAEQRGPGYGTCHDYRPPVPDGPRIDWVLTTPGVAVAAAGVNTYHHPGDPPALPSDHLPVQARLRLPLTSPGSVGDGHGGRVAAVHRDHVLHQ